MNAKVTLLPCPFCGSGALTKWQRTSEHAVLCEDCGATANTVERWNRRQSLSQEAVREEALGDIPNDVCQAGMDAWNDTFGSPYTRYAAIYRAMQSALMREPNAERCDHDVVGSHLREPPAAPDVASMLKRLKARIAEEHRPSMIAGAMKALGDTDHEWWHKGNVAARKRMLPLLEEATAILARLGLGLVPVREDLRTIDKELDHGIDD